VRKRIARLTSLIVLSIPLAAQIKEQGKFIIRISEVKRTGHACTVLAHSEKVTYQLTSNASAGCAMLEAGNDYKAYRAVSGNNSGEEKDDFAVLIVFNNVENKRRPNAVFEIASERVVSLKACPGNDPLGLRTNEDREPLPPQKKN
jgi:hypothetical protein